ncbi:unnamed protein product [Scytosiphon promiscuus]
MFRTEHMYGKEYKPASLGRPYLLDSGHSMSPRSTYIGESSRQPSSTSSSPGAHASSDTIHNARKARDVQHHRPSEHEFRSAVLTREEDLPEHPAELRSQNEAFSTAGTGDRSREGDAAGEGTHPSPSSSSPPSGAIESKPLNPSHRHGSLRGTDGGCMPQDGDAAGGPFQCVTPTLASSPARCEFAGCQRTPRYGVKDGPARFCQGHKIAGMYTRRDGVLLMATRDGAAFREADPAPGSNDDGSVAATVSGRTARGTAPQAAPSSQGPKLLTSPKTTSPVPRKKCEAPGCNVQPSYGDVGSSRPRFCSGHKKDRMVSLKNRPCLYPGCIVRPHYGLSMGRAVFCVTHKKEGMVHLLRESKTLKKDALKRKIHEHRDDVKEESDVAESSVRHPREDGGWAELHYGQERKERGAARGAASGARRSVAESGGKNPKKTAEAPGLAPSDEIRLVREARELAQAAAKASGSGRRARVPSRKLLEASGVLAAGDSAQWMTKEKKEEQARITKELKEQRKAAAAAGLKVGQVIETIVPTIRGTSNRKQETLGSATARRGGTAASRASWRKLTPAELRASGKHPAAEGTAPNPPRNNTTILSVANVLTVSNEQERRASAALAAADDATLSENNGEGVEPTSAAEPCLAKKRAPSTAETVSTSSPKRSRIERGAEGDTPCASKRNRSEEQGDRKATAAKVTCELESCSRTAEFGINGVVRYCKMHRIFGMYKIVGVK